MTSRSCRQTSSPHCCIFFELWDLHTSQLASRTWRLRLSLSVRSVGLLLLLLLPAAFAANVKDVFTRSAWEPWRSMKDWNVKWLVTSIMKTSSPVWVEESFPEIPYSFFTDAKAKGDMCIIFRTRDDKIFCLECPGLPEGLKNAPLWSVMSEYYLCGPKTLASPARPQSVSSFLALSTSLFLPEFVKFEGMSCKDEQLFYSSTRECEKLPS